MSLQADYSIRPLQTWDEYLACEALEANVWQMPEGRGTVPAWLLITAHRNGGVVLGAFDARNRLIGFVFGFLGLDHGPTRRRLKHCSQMLAVLPEWRGLDVGLALKLAQREMILEQGIDLVTWTYDPLQAVNARLNVVRLGAFARRYVVNAYGEMTDGLNAGVASDRFEVEWWVATSRVDRILRGAAPVHPWEPDASVFEVRRVAGLPEPLPRRAAAGASRQVEIPLDWNGLRRSAPELAAKWRVATREAFLELFDLGFAVTGMAAQGRGRECRIGYRLEKSAEFLQGI